MPIPQIPSKLIAKTPAGLVQILPETAVDSAMADGSQNPVAGGAVAAAVEDISEALGLNGRLHVVDGELTADIAYAFSNESFIVNLEPEIWTFTANVGAELKTAVPFNLHYLSCDLHVDWGDGTESDLSSGDYSVSANSASIHTYSAQGTYQVQVSSRNWSLISILTVFSQDLLTSANSNGATEAIRIWRSTVSNVSPLPRLRGSRGYPDLSTDAMFTTYQKRLSHAFCQCANLASVPEELLSDNPDATTFEACFSGCSSLASIPQELFGVHSGATSFRDCFAGCTALGDFDIRIVSEVVEDAEGFVTQKSGASRTVRVPSGSATQTAFNAVASSLGLTVIGE